MLGITLAPVTGSALAALVLGYPARTTVQAGLYGFRIEVEVLARRPTQT